MENLEKNELNNVPENESSAEAENELRQTDRKDIPEEVEAEAVEEPAEAGESEDNSAPKEAEEASETQDSEEASEAPEDRVPEDGAKDVETEVSAEAAEAKECSELTKAEVPPETAEVAEQSATAQTAEAEEAEAVSDEAETKKKPLRIFRNALIAGWIIALLGVICAWQVTSLKNTAVYLKTDTKDILKSFAALDAAEAEESINYLEEDLARFNRKINNPFWKTVGFVCRRDIGSARLLVASLETADAEIFIPMQELLETCPPKSASAAAPWLSLYDEVLPVVSDIAKDLDGVNFRLYDRDGKIRGYINILSYFTRVLELADDDFVRPAVKLLSAYPISEIKTETGYDFNALVNYLDFLVTRAPGLADTIKGISPDELSKIDSDGRLSSLCSQASGLADFCARLSDSVVKPAAQLIQQQPLSGLAVDGGFNAALIRSYAELLEQVLPEARSLCDEFYSLDLSSIDKDGKITGIVGKIKALLEKYEPAEVYLPLLKVLMGNGEDRTYVFPVQNSSELRASGGFPGSVGLITIRDGVLSFGEFSGVHDFFTMYCSDRYHITAEEKSLFSSNMVLTWDACYCPNFERAGQIFAYATEDKLKIPIDGTVSMTPAVFQEVLKIFGEITVFDGTVVNGENATRVIQRDVYFKYYSYGSTNNLYAADSFFGDCARKAMELVKEKLNKDNILELFRVFREGVDNRTIMLWMADEEEEEIIKAAGCSGGMNHDAENPRAGIYISGFNACKLGWWFGAFPTISNPVVNADGSRTYEITVTTENVLTWREFYQVSVNFVTGGYGTYCMYTHFFAPEGGSISDFRCIGEGARQTDVEYEGLQGVKATYSLNPGDTCVFSYKITTAPGVDTPLRLSMTPTLQDYWS